LGEGKNPEQQQGNISPLFTPNPEPNDSELSPKFILPSHPKEL